MQEGSSHIKEILTNKYADSILELFPDTTAKIGSRRAFLVKELEKLVEAYWRQESEEVVDILLGIN